jgi:6-phosphogluconolactonase
MVAVEVIPDPEAAGQRAAEIVAETVRRAIADRSRCTWAISGGGSLAPMFRRLGALGLPWHLIDTWQVDERVAPIGGPERNRSEQEGSLPPEAGGGIRWMPVEDDDLEAAAARYAATLPEWFDIVHLGIGADGHTASLVPGDPVLDVQHRDVAVTDPYEGRRRMTLTYPGLSRARRVLWLVSGSEKREALRRLIRGDRSIPAARVPVGDQVVITDQSPGAEAGAEEEP